MRKRKALSTRRVEAHGLGIHLTDWKGEDPTIVMLHGLGFTGRMFDPLARALAPAFRVVCPDLRGHGRTDHPPEGYQYPNLIQDLLGSLQMLHISKLVLVGHTWGADVAMAFAASHPKRLLGLVLIDGGYRHRRVIPGHEEPPAPEEVKGSIRFSSIEAAISDAKQQLGVVWSDDLQVAIEDSLEIGRDNTVSYRLNNHTWGQIYKALWAYDPTPYIETVKTQTLIVHPEGPEPSSPQGTTASFQARAAALLMEDARTVTFPDKDNLSLLANPDLAKTLLAFLGDVRQTPKTP